MALLNACADVFNGDRCLSFHLNISQHLYFVYARTKGPGETARKLAVVFAAQRCDDCKYLVY